MSTPDLPNRDAGPPSPGQRFTIDEYHRLIDEGVLSEADRFELLESWVFPIMPQEPPHDGVVQLVQAQLLHHLPETHILRLHSALTLHGSEPAPDLAVAVGPGRRYTQIHPGPRDVPLVVEIAGSSLALDRGLKLQVYATARIPIYWIVNLVERQVEVYSAPKAGKSPGYRQRQDYGAKDVVPVILDGEEIGRLRIEDLLP